MTVKLTGNFLATARCLIFDDATGIAWSFNSNTNEVTAQLSGSVPVPGGLVTVGTNPVLTTASTIQFNTTPVGSVWLVTESYDSTYNGSWGNIFQVASQAISTSTAPVVAVYGAGIGSAAGAKVWGANFACVVNNAGATGIGIEVDVNMPVAGTGYGIAIDAVGANQAIAALQVQSNTIAGGFQYGLNFNNTTRTGVGDTLLRSLNSSCNYGINFSGSFATAELNLPSFVVGATPSGINGAIQILGSASATPTISAVGSAAAINLNLVSKGTGTVQVNGSPISTAVGANPSASIGLTAVNGTAATWMTSDSAPALSQAIIPTWTKAHIFSPSVGVGVTINGVANTLSQQITGSSTSGQSFGLKINAGTTSADFPLSVANQGGTKTFIAMFGDGHFVLGHNGSANTLTGSATGDLVVAAPASGVALTVNPVSGLASPAIQTSGAISCTGGPLLAAATQVFTGVANRKLSLSTSANSTLTADAALTVTCNETGWYDVVAYLPFYEATSGAGGFQFDFNGGSATVANPVFSVTGFSTAAFTNAAITSISTTTSIGTVGTSSTAPSWALVKGTIQVTAAGTVAIRWAQASILAIDPTTLAAGASIILTKIG